MAWNEFKCIKYKYLGEMNGYSTNQIYSLYTCFRKLRTKLASKILICLCLSLLLLLIIFVAGVNQIKYPLICHVTSTLLHYFTLTTFFWMGVEAVNLYRAVVRVFTRGSDVRFFRCMFVNAWGRLLFNDHCKS